MRTLGQKRAEFALKKVQENLTVDKLKPFSSGAPNMILQNGFGQALAFWAQKSNDGNNFEVIFNIVKEWLEENEFIDVSDNKRDFILKISQMSQQEYLKCQKESISLLEWVKRYANAFCED
jgi:CRISPR-associated protein Cmr5